MLKQFLAAGAAVFFSTQAWASTCSGLPSFKALKAAVTAAVGVTGNGGLGNNMWATIVANDGTVCAVAFSGGSFTDQWLASRVIPAQKASTGNSLSLGAVSKPGNGNLALSTANLFTAVQPGGSLYGLQHSNPVDPEVAYKGSASDFGQANDPLVGERVGGINVFGGGLALYDKTGKVGGLGVSGDTSCTDHMVAWQIRHALKLDLLATDKIEGVSGDPARPDNIIFDIVANGDGTGSGTPTGPGGVGTSPSGFGHPQCLNNPNPSTLPAVQ